MLTRELRLIYRSKRRQSKRTLSSGHWFRPSKILKCRCKTCERSYKRPSNCLNRIAKWIKIWISLSIAQQLMSSFRCHCRICLKSWTKLKCNLSMSSVRSSMICLTWQQRARFLLPCAMTTSAIGMMLRLKSPSTLQTLRQLSICAKKWLKYSSSCKRAELLWLIWIKNEEICLSHQIRLLRFRRHSVRQ